MEADHIEVFKSHANGSTIDAYCWAIVDKEGEVLCSLLDKYALEEDYIKVMLADGEMYFEDKSWRESVKIVSHVPDEYKSSEAKRMDKLTLNIVKELVRSYRSSRIT